MFSTYFSSSVEFAICLAILIVTPLVQVNGMSLKQEESTYFHLNVNGFFPKSDESGHIAARINPAVIGISNSFA